MPVLKVRDPNTGLYVPLLSGVATDHGSLSGLGDDDHPQYLTNARGNALYVKKAGDTMTGPLVLPADPTLALQSATKQYVDTGGYDVAGARRNLYGTGHVIPNASYVGITSGLTPQTGDGGDGAITYSAGLLTLQSAGVVELMASGSFPGLTGGRRIMSLRVNGVGTYGQMTWAGNSGAVTMTVTTPGVWYAAGTYFQIEMYQDSGNSITMNSLRFVARKVANG